MSWEYKVMPLSKDFVAQAAQLNAVGEAGWELNCVSDGHAYFERMKFEENEGIKLVERCECGCVPDLAECAC